MRWPSGRGRGSLLLRITATSVLLVALTATLGAVGMLALQKDRLISGIDSVARSQADNVAALAEQGTLPDVLVVLAGDLDVIQVVDANGDVVASSANISGEPPIADFAPGGRGTGRGAGHTAKTVRTPVGDDVDFRMVAVPAQSSSQGELVVYAGGSMASVNDSITTTALILLWAVPLLVAMMGLLIWRTVGRALAPVEAIRSQVADISSSSLHKRVPEAAPDDEISRLARTMNLLLARLESAAMRQRQFIADAAHELLSPIALARTELEVALTHPETQHWQTSAHNALDVCTEMEQLIRDLLLLARSEEGTQPTWSKVVDLRDVVTAEVDSIRATSTSTFELVADQPALSYGDANQLRRLTRNLLENATHHSRARVAVELSTRGDVATLTVCDDGAGIAAGDRETVFERFTRLDPARNRTAAGVGLGLAICRAIAQRHGGSVRAEDPLDLPGARIVVRLPTTADGETEDLPTHVAAVGPDEA